MKPCFRLTVKDAHLSDRFKIVRSVHDSNLYANGETNLEVATHHPLCHLFDSISACVSVQLKAAEPGLVFRQL